MPASFEVTCIRKRQHQDPHERIEALGGRQANGGAWRLSEAEAIAGLNLGKLSLYVSVGGKTVQVVVAEHMGRAYLKTTADGYAPNNLLSLPECPP